MKCKNPNCKNQARKGSKYCSHECRINHETVFLNPRPSNEEIERKTILKAYLNCVVLPNIPQKNLPALHLLLENAYKISETQGNEQAKLFLKTQLERIKNARKR